MRSETKVLLVTLALGPVVYLAPQVSEAVTEMETFRVDDVEVRGIRFLTEDTVVARLELGQFASVWGDKAAWEERLERHPLVRDAEVHRRLPNRLRVTVEERRPVALAATPILEPVDGEGHRLPIDPTRYGLDLPIIAAERMPPTGAAVFPEEVRVAAAEVARLARLDEEFVRRISSLRRDADGSLRLHLVSPDVDLLVLPETTTDRLREAEAALTDAISRDPSRLPEVVDLRFADQVVVRRNPEE